MYSKRTLLLGCLLFIALVMISGCTTAASEQSAEEAEHEEAGDEHAIHWGYEGEEGPEHWGDLDPEYILCSTGNVQTPIDITGVEEADAPDITFNYQASEINFINNGHSVQVNYDEGSSIEFEGVTYNLLQFHFHTPSENAWDGDLLDMEMHLVHADADGNLAVVGVMFISGAENSTFTPIVENIPEHAGDEVHPEGVTINAAEMLPESLLAYQFMGSLTTPPCSEGVHWFVLTTPVELSEGQLDMFRSVMGKNNRPLQSLNDRDIVEDIQ